MEIAERPGQRWYIRIGCRALITAETLLESVFLFLLILCAGTVLAIGAPLRWAYLEINDTWNPP